MIKVLAIGNSFSQDAVEYLPALARSAGQKLMVANLYIGGCSLARHWANIVSGEQTYEKTIDSSVTSISSLPDAVRSDDWDYITLQQVSQDAGRPETWEPYLGQILAFLGSACPDAEVLLHQTWAYDTGSDHEGFAYYGYDQERMYQQVRKTCNYYAELYQLRLIPSGDAFQLARSLPQIRSMRLCRDGFHASLDLGRYLLASTWFTFLFPEAPRPDFRPAPMMHVEPVTSKDYEWLRACAYEVN